MAKVRVFGAAATAAAGLLIASAAWAATPAGGLPPSGTYACMAGSGLGYGNLEINGATYRGVFYTPAGAFHALRAGPDGLAFTGGLGDFEAAGARPQRADYMGPDGSSNHQPWIRIGYQTPGGNTEELDCERQP